jgi:hypothetical protein
MMLITESLGRSSWMQLPVVSKNSNLLKGEWLAGTALLGGQRRRELGENASFSNNLFLRTQSRSFSPSSTS